MRLLISSGLVALCSLYPALDTAAESLVPRGDDIQVNSYTSGNQGFPEIAVRPDGSFVIAWESDGQDASKWGVFAQIFNADGTPFGGEFQVNTTEDDTEWDPSVAADGAGNFIVAWHGFVSGEGFNVLAQRFDSSGNPLGGEFQANTATANYQGNTTVAAQPSGEFLIVWESDNQDGEEGGVYAQLYDAAGAAVGQEVRVNDTTANDQNDARVAPVDGGYVVTWESFLQDGSEDSTVIRFLDATAAPDGAEILVNTEVLGSQEDPAVSVSSDGTIAVVWESTSQDGQGEGIFAQVLDSDGMAVGGEFQVNAYTTGDQKNPRVAPDGTGGFVAVWTSEDQRDGEDVFGRRFDSSGALVGEEFEVNAEASSDQDVPNIAGGPGEQFVVTWRSFGGQDGSNAGVFARRFQVALFADGFESGDTSAWSVVVP